MPQEVIKPATEHRCLAWFHTDSDQIARHSDREAILHRGQDMLANGQHQPVGAEEDGRLIFGHGRFLSAQAVEMKELWVRIYPGKLTDTAREVIRFAENFHRNELSAHSKWLTCTKIISGNPTMSQRQLADALHISESMAVRLLSPSKLIVAWQDALREGRVGISDCYEASKTASEREQAELLATKLAGASRDDLARAGRQRRNGDKPAVRVARVQCILPSGVNVVVSGDGVSLDESIEALGDAIKEMKRARALGYSAKTFQAALRDRATKGGA